MVFEYLVSVLKAEKKPWDMFFLGFLYVSIALFLSLWLFPSDASIVSVLLVVLASLPIVYDAIRFEEKKEVVLPDEVHILKHHEGLVLLILFLFFGFSIGFAFWYSVLPSDMVNVLFKSQSMTIQAINSPEQLQALQSQSKTMTQTTQTTGSLINNSRTAFSYFSIIFLNNVKVLMFCLLFSFLYGSGALFILAWNASVIGVAVGNLFRTLISKISPSLFSYFHITTLSLLRYFLHGIPEVLAYLIGGIAGSLLSVAIINHDLSTKNFDKIISDVADLIIISLFLLLIASFIEVFITPLVFSLFY